MSSKIVAFILLVICFQVNAQAQGLTMVVPTSHNEKIYQIAIDPNDKYFYTADDFKVIMWDFKTMRQLYSFKIANKLTETGIDRKVRNLRDLIISSDGKIIAFTTANDSLKIFSTVTGKLLRAIPNINSKILFSKDLKTIYYMVIASEMKNRSVAKGWMVKSINIASGIINDYWQLKNEIVWYDKKNYFFPLAGSRVINFNETGYQVLDIENKKEIAIEQIPLAIRKGFSESDTVFNIHEFRVYHESGLFVFDHHKNKKVGKFTWDIYANKEFAFVPDNPRFHNVGNFNPDRLVYLTDQGQPNKKQELVIYSRDYKIEKKKLLNVSDEIYMAALGKKNNIVLSIDNNNKIYKSNIENAEKETTQRGLPEINISSFYKDGNLLSFNGLTTVSDNISLGRYDNYRSDYIIDLSRAALYGLDTMPTIPAKVVSSLRLSKDSFLLCYNSMKTQFEDGNYFIYDKKNKKSTAFIVKDFYFTNDTKSRNFLGLPNFFTLSTPGIAYYTNSEYRPKETNRSTYHLYKYNLLTKKTDKIFSTTYLNDDEWENKGRRKKDKPLASQQLIIDKENEILASAENDDKGSIKIIDIKTNKIIATHPFAFDPAIYKNKNTDFNRFYDRLPFVIKQVKQIDKNVVRVLGDETLYEFNLAAGLVKEKKLIEDGMLDEKRNVNVFGNNKLSSVILTYDDENETIVKSIHGPNKFKLDHITSPVSNISFTQNDSILYTINADKTMNAYNAITGKFYGTLYVFENSTDWVFVGADGRFDGTDNGMKKLYYLNGRETINLDKLYEKYYTPNLFVRLTNGEQFEPIPEINIKPKPSSKILYAEKKRNLEVEDDLQSYSNTTGVAEINIVATAPEDRVDEIRLFHNGKVVNLATRGLFVTDNDGSDSKKYTINLLPGNNNFRAVALNSQRTESEADEIMVNYNVAVNNAPVEVKPVNNNAAIVSTINKDATLHLIVVGINEYQNKTMSLNYAMADATSFKEELEKDSKTILSNIKTYFVTNSTADKTGITNAFKQVQQNAKAQDVFIFYYAGHGVIGKDKEFYLVPTDVSDLKNVQSELEQKGIASKLLQQYAIDIQAQKQLFILDACQSAGAFEKLLSNDGNQQKSLAVVARSTGTHWMAASGAMQYANEFSSLGHGVFTYVLLQALKGEAANNKMITVNGLKSFLQVQVPLLMKKYNGAAQYPASYGLGNDFPVQVLK